MSNIEGNNQGQDDERIECLRLILERQQSRSVSLEEAAEIGDSLMVLFQVLGEDIPTDDSPQQAQMSLGVAHG
jgi:hypothetical protein